MKSRIRVLFISMLILSLTIGKINAQYVFPGFNAIPFKSTESPLFGKDIVINNKPEQNQRNVAVCSAFNGWLFSIYTYIDLISNFPFLTISKSVDNGITWEVLIDSPLGNSGTEVKSINILTLGDNESNLKVFFSGVIKYLSTPTGDGFVIRMNGISGILEAQIFTEPNANEISLACFSTTTADSSILGILYSKYSPSIDSLILQSSNDGGFSFNNRKTVAVASAKFSKVALSFGRCSSFPKGNFFAAWEEKNSYGESLGHISSSHTFPDYNSSFTQAIYLDELNISDAGLCRNPSIGCQINNFDNDSSNLTEVVLFDRYNSITTSFDIRGYFNLQAVNHSEFKKLSLTDSLHYNVESDINYNPYDSSFNVTYFDSTTLKIPLFKNNFNLREPDNWSSISEGYNDSSNIIAPYPKIRVSPSLPGGMNVWNSEGPGSKGISLFDSPSSTWTGFSNTGISHNREIITAYPNPFDRQIQFTFTLAEPSYAVLSVTDIQGRHIATILSGKQSEGKHQVTWNGMNDDARKIPPGLYLSKLTVNNQTVGVHKIIKY